MIRWDYLIWSGGVCVIFSAFRLYIYTFVFFVITLIFFIAGIYLDVSVNGTLEEQNSELASQRMDNLVKDLLSNFDKVIEHADILQRYIEDNPKVTNAELKNFVELNLLPKDLSAFFNADTKDFIIGYMIAPNDSFFIVSDEPQENFTQLNFSDKTTEFYLDLARRNPRDVIVHGPIVSPRTHEINIFNRKAVYVEGKYWGYVGVIVDFYKLLDCMNLNSEKGRFVYSIKSYLNKEERDFIWGDSTLFKHRDLVYRQRSVFFGKHRWDLALKVRNAGKAAELGNKVYFILFLFYLLALILVFYLFKYFSELKNSKEVDPITLTIGHDKFLKLVKDKINGNADHGVVVLELIHFNQINSCYDFTIGDKLLCEVTRRIKNVVSYNDLICRVGSQFIVLMQNIRSNVDVDRVQSELYDEMEKNFNIDEVSINLKAVIGSSSTISKGRSYNEIMNEISESILETKKSMKFFSRTTDISQNE